MKKFLTLMIGMILLNAAQAQNLTWTSFYSAPYQYLSDGNNLWAVSGNILIQLDKTTGYYTRISIPDSIFTCNGHFATPPNTTNTPPLILQGGYPFVAGGTNNAPRYYSYDGQQWGTIPYQVPVVPSFVYNKTVTDSSGNIYFFSDSLGMVIYNPITTNYTFIDTYKTIVDSIYHYSGMTGAYTPMCFDESGNLWIGLSYEGMLKYDGSHFTFYDTTALGAFYNTWGGSFAPNSIYCDYYTNNIYVTTDAQNVDSLARFYVFDGTRWHSDTMPLTIAKYFPGFMFFGPGMAYFCQAPNSIVSFDGTSYSYVSLPTTSTTGLMPGYGPVALDEGGTYWLFVNGILTYFDGYNFYPNPDPQAILPDNAVLGILEDKRHHKLWFGSEYGITYMNSAGSHCFQTPYGGARGQIEMDTAGRLWFGPNYFSDTVHSFAHSGAGTYAVECYAVGRDDTLWAATDIGIKIKVGDTLLSFRNLAIPNDFYTAVAVDTANVKWFARFPTMFGSSVNYSLIRYAGGVVTTFDSTNSPVSDTLLCLAIDAQNRLWVGTGNKGILIYNGSTWSGYNTLNSSIPSDRVESISFKNGLVYISTQDNGIGIYDGNSWTNFTPHNSPMDEDAETIAIDDSCNIWIGEECGLLKLSGYCGMNAGYRLLYGHSHQPDGSPSVHEAIYLMQYDSAANKMKTIDNTYTDGQGAYRFSTNLSDVYLHAVPYNGAASGGIMPAYEDSNIVQQNARPIRMTSSTVMRDLWSVQGQAMNGGAALSGVVNDVNGHRVAGLRLFVMSAGQPVATTLTAMDGKFSFTGLALGSYHIWVDKMGIDNILSPSVTLSRPGLVSATCQLSANLLRILTVGISESDAEASLNIYPNPASGMVTVYLPGAEPADMTIYDMTGKEMLKKALTPGHQRIDIADIPGGIYQVRVQSSMISETRKLVVKK